MGAHRATTAAQVRALGRAFLGRLFDHDITGGAEDLKTTFFWLAGFLAAPGFLIPFMMIFQWDLVARLHGPAALRAASLSSKLLYLSLGMTASAALTTVTWNNLLLDRLDALIVGGLPVRPRTIVASKLAALLAYLGLLTLALHGCAALSFGLVLAAGRSMAFAFRGVAAHFVASAAGSALVMLTATSLQGAVLAIAGPRVFARLSSLLQAAVIGAILVALAVEPSLARATHGTLAGSGTFDRPWMLWTPPFWFLGLYEWLLGTADPVFIGLALRAVASLAIAAALTCGTYAVAYARLARTAVEGAAPGPSRGRLAATGEWICRRVSADPVRRASVQFFIASLMRVDRLRFVMAIAMGVVVGWSGPLLYYSTTAAHEGRPPQAILALSLADMAFILAGLRVAAAMPADLKSAWMVPMVDASGRRLRSGLWRIMFLIGVTPVALMFVPGLARVWGPRVALQHMAVLVASGALLVESVLWKYERMPSCSPWRPDAANLGKRWPFFVGAFLAYSAGIATLEAVTLDRLFWFVALVAGLAALTAVVRLQHERRWEIALADDYDDVHAPAVLDLH
jgi:hypothetical protein